MNSNFSTDLNVNFQAMFVKAGVLIHLVSMMGEENSTEERNSALKAVWVLSFCPENKDKLLEEKGLIDGKPQLHRDVPFN